MSEIEPPHDSSRIRTFIAVELPQDVKRMLSEVEIRLKRRMVSSLGMRSAEQSLKWVDPEGLHITLKFLGYVEASKISLIEEALRKATGNSPQFKLLLEGLGAFPTLNRPRVIWMGVRGDIERLGSLQSQVEAAMAQLGFPVEKRSFSPHLTLARIRETASVGEARLIGQAVKEFSGTPIEPRVIVVDHISLMRSELSRQGARYTRLASWELAR